MFTSSRRRKAASLPEERLHAGHHFLQLLAGELREDRQREDLPGGALALGELTGLVAQIGEAGLQVERERVVDRRADAALLEEGLERVPPAARDPERVLVEDGLVLGRHVRRDERTALRQLGEGGVVERGIGAPL